MRIPLLISTLALLLAGQAGATTISFQATSLGGTSWRYDYAVSNDSLAGPIGEFTIYFAVGTFANLAVSGTPAGWDPIVAQPDVDIPAAGFFDALATAGGIAPDAVVAGYAVTFDYLGAGAPGAQPFEVVDPVSFTVLSSGSTTVVPAPGAAWLLGTAVLAAVTRARCRARAGPMERIP